MESEVGDRPRRTGRLAAALVLFLVVSTLAVLLLHGSRGENVSPANHANLGQRISELQVAAPDLSAALVAFQEKTRTNLAIDRQSLKDAGIVWDEPVKIHLWDTTVGSALGALFAAAGDRGSVAFTSDGGFILVAAGARSPPATV